MPALVVTLGATKFRAAFACAEAVDESPFADPKFWCRFSQSRMRGWLRLVIRFKLTNPRTCRIDGGEANQVSNKAIYPVTYRE